jgi:hypothetical protein
MRIIHVIPSLASLLFCLMAQAATDPAPVTPTVAAKEQPLSATLKSALVSALDEWVGSQPLNHVGPGLTIGFTLWPKIQAQLGDAPIPGRPVSMMKAPSPGGMPGRVYGHNFFRPELAQLPPEHPLRALAKELQGGTIRALTPEEAADYDEAVWRGLGNPVDKDDTAAIQVGADTFIVLVKDSKLVWVDLLPGVHLLKVR